MSVPKSPRKADGATPPPTPRRRRSAKSEPARGREPHPDLPALPDLPEVAPAPVLAAASYEHFSPGDGALRGLVGIIDVGSSAIRLLLAEIQGPGEWRPIDGADKAVALGRDVFTSGKVSARTMTQALQILFGFRELMESYGVRRVRAFGTSALREAINRETFIDRVRLRTGFAIEIVDGLEANFLTYLGVIHALGPLESKVRRTNALIIEVGGGSTELMVLQQGRMVAAHTLHIGTVRTDLRAQTRGQGHFGDLLEAYQRENLRGTLEVLNAELPLSQIDEFIAVGGEARLVAKRRGQPAGTLCMSLDRNELRVFVNRLASSSVDETVKLLGIPYRDAENLLPALLLYLLLAEATAAKRLLVPLVSIREGALLEMSRGASAMAPEELRRQVLTGAHGLGRKFNYDQDHAHHVATLSGALFDAMLIEHGLGNRHRLLLEAAGILHDIGTYINPSAHHKHGQYLVANSEIFGLRRNDLDIIANVIRYHRKSMPKPTHLAYMALAPEDRLVVLKLASILRVADGLDRGHRHRLQQVSFEKREGELVLRASASGATHWLEQLSVSSKSDLFEEVFGLRVVLL